MNPKLLQNLVLPYPFPLHCLILAFRCATLIYCSVELAQNGLGDKNGKGPFTTFTSWNIFLCVFYVYSHAIWEVANPLLCWFSPQCAKYSKWIQSNVMERLFALLFSVEAAMGYLFVFRILANNDKYWYKNEMILVHVLPGFYATAEFLLVPHKLTEDANCANIYRNRSVWINFALTWCWTVCYQITYWLYYSLYDEYVYGSSQDPFYTLLFIVGMPAVFWVMVILFRLRDRIITLVISIILCIHSLIHAALRQRRKEPNEKSGQTVDCLEKWLECYYSTPRNASIQNESTPLFPTAVHESNVEKVVKNTWSVALMAFILLSTTFISNFVYLSKHSNGTSSSSGTAQFYVQSQSQFPFWVNSLNALNINQTNSVISTPNQVNENDYLWIFSGTTLSTPTADGRFILPNFLMTTSFNASTAEFSNNVLLDSQGAPLVALDYAAVGIDWAVWDSTAGVLPLCATYLPSLNRTVGYFQVNFYLGGWNFSTYSVFAATGANNFNFSVVANDTRISPSCLVMDGNYVYQFYTKPEDSPWSSLYLARVSIDSLMTNPTNYTYWQSGSKFVSGYNNANSVIDHPTDSVTVVHNEDYDKYFMIYMNTIWNGGDSRSVMITWADKLWGPWQEGRLVYTVGGSIDDTTFAGTLNNPSAFLASTSWTDFFFLYAISSYPNQTGLVGVSLFENASS